MSHGSHISKQESHMSRSSKPRPRIRKHRSCDAPPPASDIIESPVRDPGRKSQAVGGTGRGACLPATPPAHNPHTHTPFPEARGSQLAAAVPPQSQVHYNALCEFSPSRRPPANRLRRALRSVAASVLGITGVYFLPRSCRVLAVRPPAFLPGLCG